MMKLLLRENSFMTEKLSDKDLQIMKERFCRNLADIKAEIAKAAEESGRKSDDIILLAATKTVPVEMINFAASCGVNFAGENRVQEFVAKLPQMDEGIHRHFIGHLQTNKVKQIVGNVELIHSVDSEKLAREIAKQSLSKGIVSDILLEVNIGREATKSGFLAEELLDNFNIISKIDGIRVRGLMCIPPDEEKYGPIDRYFAEMKKLFIDISAINMDNNSMQYLSMGMSGDFAQAIRYGANIVRIGTALFGERNYNIK